MTDEEEYFGSRFENGHWEWDVDMESLVFVSDLPPPTIENVLFTLKIPTGAIEFRDDIDLIEQLRFRKRFQRKLKFGASDAITVQDVKDIALYTAPLHMLSPTLINILHIPTTERFIRALILYCQYYLQVVDEMKERLLEQETKVRTPLSDIIETEFRENLSDLRLLAAKEYSVLLLGGSDAKNFHHMGPVKKRRSLSDKDAQLFEMLIRMCVQIVWLALGRKSFNTIELEINRALKSDIFNSTEHNLKTGYIDKMTKNEKSTLQGHCLGNWRKLNMQSPLMVEVFCHRPMDYRQFGLGVLKYNNLTSRLRYMLLALAAPEEELPTLVVTVGILGLSRSKFDTMLRPIACVEGGSTATTNTTSSLVAKSRTRQSRTFTQSTVQKKLMVYPDVILPPKGTADDGSVPPSFPDVPEDIPRCSETQRRIWQARLCRLQSLSTSFKKEH